MEKNCITCHIKETCHLKLIIDDTLRANPQYFDRTVRTEDNQHLGIFEALANRCIKYKTIGGPNE